MQELRDYQKQLLDKVKEKFKEGKKRVLLMSPVGSGKTIMAKSVIRDALSKGKETLFTVHRKVLLEQTFREFQPFDPSVIMGDDKRFNPDSPIHIAMIQSLVNRDLPHPDIVIMDEVHYAFNSVLIQNILEKHPNSFVIGLSATPVDEKGYLLEGFDAIVDDIQMHELIEMRWLVPFEVYSPVKLDLSSVRIRGDYVDSDLAMIVDEPNMIKTVVDNYEKYGQSKKFICFAINQEHGKHIRDEFENRGLKTAYIDASTKNREEILIGLKNGDYSGIVNINVLTAGFDEPSIGCVIIANPSKSWRKFIQECGRGSRLLGLNYEESVKNGKPNCILIDLGNAVEEHGMPDSRVKLKFPPHFSKVIDREMNIDENIEERNEIIEDTSDKKRVFLRKIGSLLDLYDGKVYEKEQELVDDIIKFLKKSELFYFRQNSGVAKFGWAVKGSIHDFLQNNPSYSSSSDVLYAFAGFLSGGKERFVQFTSKAGLPDVAIYSSIGSMYFGIEVKMPDGRLTDNQKITLPEMINLGIFVSFAQSILDVYEVLCHIEENVIRTDGGVIIKDSLYDLPEKQNAYFKKYKLQTYRQSWKV